MTSLELPHSEFRQWAMEREKSARFKKNKVQEMQTSSSSSAPTAESVSNELAQNLNYEMIEYLQEMLTTKTTELEMTAEYGLELSTRNDQLQGEITKLVYEIEQLRNINRSLENQVTELRVALEDQKYLIAAEEEQSGGLDDESAQRLRNAEAAQAQQQNRINKLEAEVARLQEALRLSEDGNGEQKERENWLKAQVNRLQSKFNEMEEERESWKLEEELLREELDQLRENSGKGGDNDALALQLEQAEMDRDKLKDKVSSLQSQIDELRRELDDFKEGGAGPGLERHDSNKSLGLGGDDNLSGLDGLDGFSINVQRASFSLHSGEGLSQKQMEINCNLELARELIDEDDVYALISYLNKEFTVIADECGHKFPLKPDVGEIFYACKNGVLLCKLVNKSRPNTIDERVINMNPTDEEVHENFNLIIDSCKSIGCVIPKDIDVDRILVGAACEQLMQIIWTLIRSILVKRLSLQQSNELRNIAYETDLIEDLVSLSPELWIIRWVNFHLKGAPELRIKKFDDDLSNLEVISEILKKIHQLDAPYMKVYEPTERINGFIAQFTQTFPNACLFVNANGLLHRNPKMVFAFLATLYNLGSGIEGAKEKGEHEDLEDFSSKATNDVDREAEVLTLWMNSLAMEPTVVDLFEDLRDGIFLIKIFDKLNPGSVDWTKVATKKPVPKFMKLQNANYVFHLAKVMKISVIGIGGGDLEDGNKKMTLALVWQIMRYHIQTMLMAISTSDTAITDAEVLAWANAKVAETGQKLEIKSFKDDILRDGKFFLHLMDSLKPGVVKYNLIKDDNSVDSCLQNCRYAISIARKIGAGIFVCVEDILNLRPKMIFIFVAALMATVTQEKKKKKKPAMSSSTSSALLVPGKKGATTMSTNLESPSFYGTKVPQPGGVNRNTMNLTKRKSINANSMWEARAKELVDENEVLKVKLKEVTAELEKLKAQGKGAFLLNAKQFQSPR
eukprot:c21780_g1_i1.p1 GENE.c21780_g1_i1~~c21780_g1_i1.p1  ORF type:complete len:965 (-),score=396.06 c21780_g1_i1:113-3007(-)